MNENEIRRTIETIKGQNQLVEVRILNGRKTFSGYFKNVDNLIREIKKYDCGNIYFIFNQIKDECYHREQCERMLPDVKTTKDEDIAGRDWLLVDVDGRRLSGISTTDEEKNEIKKTALAVYQYLKDAGFSEPISADSGNGYHLLYKINAKVSKENDELIERFLAVLDLHLSNDFASIDRKVGNEARITKLYGTVARKGANTTERPHRYSRIIRTPNEIINNSVALIKMIADKYPEQEKPAYQNNYGSSKFDLADFIKRNGLPVESEINESDHIKYVLSECVFDSTHDNKCASLFQNKSGAIGYNCFHNSCNGKAWGDVLKKFEPNNPALFNQREKGSYRKKDQIKPPATPQPIIKEKGEKFYRLSEINRIDKNNIVTIPSGISEIDRKIIGFNKGETTVWSGNNGSGKSTLLSQMCLNAATNGFRGIIYSGELKPQRVKDWIHLQAAGRQYIKDGKFEGTYYVPQNVSDVIDLWMNDLIYVYNNQYGNTFTQLLADMEEHVKTNTIDYILLDNLMSLDLDFDDNTQFEKQKKFIVTIADFARDYNIHIHLVAHPRKSTGFLRKTDISGSADLTNRPDNVMIVHRVNNDFAKTAGEFFDKSIVGSLVSNYSNVIEICKNRDMGYMDELVGTYFEVGSKRFLNSKFENPIFGWQHTTQQQEFSIDPFDFYKNDNTDIETPF